MWGFPSERGTGPAAREQQVSQSQQQPTLDSYPKRDRRHGATVAVLQPPPPLLLTVMMMYHLPEHAPQTHLKRTIPSVPRRRLDSKRSHACHTENSRCPDQVPYERIMPRPDSHRRRRDCRQGSSTPRAMMEIMIEITLTTIDGTFSQR